VRNRLLYLTVSPELNVPFYLLPTVEENSDTRFAEMERSLLKAKLNVETPRRRNNFIIFPYFYNGTFKDYVYVFDVTKEIEGEIIDSDEDISSLLQKKPYGKGELWKKIDNHWYLYVLN